MLQLGNIANELTKVSQDAFQNRQNRDDQLGLAIDASWQLLIPEKPARRTVRMTASPLREGLLSKSTSPDEFPAISTVVAVDGSQIPIDRHASLPYYLINTGKVVLHYGTGERPLLTSDARLFYAESQLLIDGDEGEMFYKSESNIADEREELEIDTLTSLVESIAGRENAIAFIDGTLILWAQDPRNSSRHKDPAVDKLCRLLDVCKDSSVLPTGYISSPQSREVVSALRLELGEDNSEADSTTRLDRISDADLFWRLLPPEHRSITFRSSAKVLKKYEPDSNKICFFYLNTGWEIARIELPLWIAEDDQLVLLLHTLVLEQCKKGGGYPISLIEAHEQAVVRTNDRLNVERLIENELLRRNIPVRVSRKSIGKRTRPI